MALSGDVKLNYGIDHGSDGPLAGQTAEQIYRAHHNLDPVTGKLLPGFTPHPTNRGCECDHCDEYVIRNRPVVPAPAPVVPTTSQIEDFLKTHHVDGRSKTEGE